MKVIVVGLPTPNPDIENYTAFNAPSYYDFDALVIDPDSLTRVAGELLSGEKEFNAQDGRTIVNAASNASGVSAGDQFQRRGAETERILESGGTVIVIGRPNAPITGIVGFEGADRYSWLPAPSGAAWSPPFLQTAEGKNVRITDDSHPVAHLLREFRRYVTYRVTLNDRLDVYRKNAHTIAVAGPGVPIAAEFPVLGGRVVVIPALNIPTGQARQQFGTALVDACLQLAGRESGQSAPGWIRSQPVPGLEQLEAEYEEADSALKAATTRAREVGERRDQLASHRRLLWTTGSEFGTAVRDALLLLGYGIDSPAREPLVVADGEERLFVETEAAAVAVVEWPYIRLQRRLEEEMLRLRKTARGLIVVNGHRMTQPDKRKAQYTDALRLAAENYGYALLTGETLFLMVQRALAGAEPDELETMRRRIARARGVLETPAALGEATESSGSEPIF